MLPMRDDDERRQTSEDSATQPMEAGGWVSHFGFESLNVRDTPLIHICIKKDSGPILPPSSLSPSLSRGSCPFTSLVSHTPPSAICNSALQCNTIFQSIPFQVCSAVQFSECCIAKYIWWNCIARLSSWDWSVFSAGASCPHASSASVATSLTFGKKCEAFQCETNDFSISIW